MQPPTILPSSLIRQLQADLLQKWERMQSALELEQSLTVDATKLQAKVVASSKRISEGISISESQSTSSLSQRQEAEAMRKEQQAENILLNRLWQNAEVVRRSQQAVSAQLQEQIVERERELLMQQSLAKRSQVSSSVDANLNTALAFAESFITQSPTTPAVARSPVAASRSIAQSAATPSSRKLGDKKFFPESVTPQPSVATYDLSCNMEKLKISAENGNSDAQARLGLNYYLGYQTSKNKSEGEKLLSLAARDLATLAGDWARARCYEFAIGQPKDFALAFYYAKKAADAGYAPAQNTVGLYYKNAIGTNPDADTAFTYFLLAANQGYAAAHNNLGRWHEMGEGNGVDEAAAKAKALVHYEAASKQNFAPALCNIARWHMMGIGTIAKNEHKAAELYQTIVDRYGFADAQCELGSCYRIGKGVEADQAKATEYLTLAADQGSVSAQYLLGVHYFTHLISEDNRRRAFYYLSLVVRERYLSVIKAVSECYAKGIGVARNEQQAAKYLALAARVEEEEKKLLIDSAPTSPVAAATSSAQAADERKVAEGKGMKEESAKQAARDEDFVIVSTSPHAEPIRAERRSARAASRRFSFSVIPLAAAMPSASSSTSSLSSTSVSSLSAASTSSITSVLDASANTSLSTSSSLIARKLALTISTPSSADTITDFSAASLMEERQQLFSTSSAASSSSSLSSALTSALPLTSEEAEGSVACSMQELQELAERGDIHAKVQLGMNHCFGIQTPEDKLEGAICLKKAVHYPHTLPGDLARALCYELGINGFPRDVAIAYRIVTAVAQQGFAPAQVTLARYYANGVGVQPSSAEAKKWYIVAAKQGSAMAQFSLYQHLKTQEALEQYLKPAAKSGLACAERELAQCYAGGSGIEKNDHEAIYYYIGAANLHDAIAENEMGVRHLQGNGVKQDLEKAVEYFVKAAKQSNSEALNNLGKCYKAGTVLAQDDDKAFSCFDAAAQRGCEEAATHRVARFTPLPKDTTNPFCRIA